MNICYKILKNKNYIIILLIILLVLLLYSIYTINKMNNKNKFNNMKYIIRDDCKYLQSDTLLDIINETSHKFRYKLYLPCIYESITEEYDKLKYNKDGIYFLIDNVDIMVGKEFLYEHVLEKYGENKTITLMPKSWILNRELQMFNDEFDKNNLYILKKNTQRQNGIYISNNLTDINEMIEKDKNTDFPYMIIQELLQDPYLINGRKINLRVYVLIVRMAANTELYVYNDGFMYYTSELFQKKSKDIAKNITTGYIDRQVYDENPLTHSDFKDYLDYNNSNNSVIVFNNIYNLIKDIFSVYFDKVGNERKLYNNKKFQLFGCDIAVDDKLNSKIMEINKGPDLGAKDKRDSELKHNLVRDIFKTVGLIDNDNDINNNDINDINDNNINNSNGFIKLN